MTFVIPNTAYAFPVSDPRLLVSLSPNISSEQKTLTGREIQTNDYPFVKELLREIHENMLQLRIAVAKVSGISVASGKSSPLGDLPTMLYINTSALRID